MHCTFKNIKVQDRTGKDRGNRVKIPSLPDSTLLAGVEQVQVPWEMFCTSTLRFDNICDFVRLY